MAAEQGLTDVPPPEHPRKKVRLAGAYLLLSRWPGGYLRPASEEGAPMSIAYGHRCVLVEEHTGGLRVCGIGLASV